MMQRKVKSQIGKASQLYRGPFSAPEANVVEHEPQKLIPKQADPGADQSPADRVAEQPGKRGADRGDADERGESDVFGIPCAAQAAGNDHLRSLHQAGGGNDEHDRCAERYDGGIIVKQEDHLAPEDGEEHGEQNADAEGTALADLAIKHCKVRALCAKLLADEAR